MYLRDIRRWAGALALPAGCAFAGPTAEFLPLGYLGGPGMTSSSLAISPDGGFVVGQSASPSGQEAFRWSALEGMRALGDLPGGFFQSSATDASAGGDVVVGQSFYGGVGEAEAFRWTPAVGLQTIGRLRAEHVVSSAEGVSADGARIVGYSGTPAETEAYLWEAGPGMRPLGDLPGGSNFSIAEAISDDGERVAGWSESLNGFEAFRWTEVGGLEGLGDLPGGAFVSQAFGISGDGATIVGRSFSEVGFEAFRWREGVGMLPLGIPGGGTGFSEARDASDDGSVIVGTYETASGTSAMIWDTVNGSRNLQLLLDNLPGVDLTGWQLQFATGISADGLTVCGFGLNPDGLQEAFVARLPEPATGLGAVILGLIVAFRAKR